MTEATHPEVRVEADGVAAFTTVEDASKAAVRLVELGFDEADIEIAPRDFEVRVQHPLRRRLRNGWRLGAWLGGIAFGMVQLIAAVGLGVLLGTVLPTALAGAVMGVVLGVIVAVVQHLRAESVRFGRPHDELTPRRFEIVVHHDQDRARHGLAKWWDPSAPPARWQVPA